MQVAMYLVDAFAAHPFAGNTAGVVTDADGLSGDQMQLVARELGQTETCFVSRSHRSDADLLLRWFTPTVEVDLCGHATVAGLTCLVKEGRISWTDGLAHVRCATRVGLVSVALVDRPRRAPLVTMAIGVAPMTPATDDRAAVAVALGLPESAIAPDLPLARDDSSARLVVPVGRLDDLLSFAPNSAGMIAYGQRTSYRRFTLVCRETRDPRCLVHLRHFAPANGIPEDPVTGTAHGAVASYLDQHGLLPAGDRVTFQGEQGHAVGRPGVVTVEVDREEGQLVAVRIGGTGVIVVRGVIDVPCRRAGAA